MWLSLEIQLSLNLYIAFPLSNIVAINLEDTLCLAYYYVNKLLRKGVKILSIREHVMISLVKEHSRFCFFR